MKVNTAPINDSSDPGGIRMWPSEAIAPRIYDIANWGLIVGLTIGVVSTALLVWMGNIKETYLKTQLGSTSERAAGVERGNITLRTDLEAEKGRVAGLEKSAADAKAAQQKVETELAKQREHAATAERALLELKMQTAPRRVSAEQRQKFLSAINVPPGLKPSIKIAAQTSVPDAQDLAKDLASLLEDAGFSVDLDTTPFIIIRGSPTNIRLSAGRNRTHDREVLAIALVSAGIVSPPVEVVNADEEPDMLGLIVGARAYQKAN